MGADLGGLSPDAGHQEVLSPGLPQGESGFASVFPLLGTIRWWRIWEPWACLCLSCHFSRISGPWVGLTPPPSARLDEAPGLCRLLARRGRRPACQRGVGGREPWSPFVSVSPQPRAGKSEAVGRGDRDFNTQTTASRTFGRCCKTPKQARPFCRFQHSQDGPFCSVPSPDPSIIPGAGGVDQEPGVFLRGFVVGTAGRVRDPESLPWRRAHLILGFPGWSVAGCHWHSWGLHAPRLALGPSVKGSCW